MLVLVIKMEYQDDSKKRSLSRRTRLGTVTKKCHELKVMTKGDSFFYHIDESGNSYYYSTNDEAFTIDPEAKNILLPIPDTINKMNNEGEVTTKINLLKKRKHVKTTHTVLRPSPTKKTPGDVNFINMRQPDWNESIPSVDITGDPSLVLSDPTPVEDADRATSVIEPATRPSVVSITKVAKKKGKKSDKADMKQMIKAKIAEKKKR